jgi:hypothetical protein
MARHKGLIRALHILAAIGLAVGMQGFDMIRPLQASAQASAFLVTPYYGSASINSYFDHDSRNNYILVYDGRTANIWNGVCGYFGELPVAYYTQPGSQGDCLWYDGHQATDFDLD